MTSSDDEKNTPMKKTPSNVKFKSNNIVVKKQFSPILKRSDIEGNDEDLSDIEEFYLIEIEQLQNNDVLCKLQQQEEELRVEIKKFQNKIKALKAGPTGRNNELALEQEKRLLVNLKNKLFANIKKQN